MQTIFINADVTTLDPSHPTGRCILVDDGVIEQVLDSRPTGLSSTVKIVDCSGGAIVPGFHDCHVHLTGTGLYGGDHDVSACRDIASVLAHIAKLAATDEVVYAGRLDETVIAERRLPTRLELDAASRGKPVLLSRVDGHSSVANSAAFELMAIDEASAEVDKDVDGRSTGRLSGAVHWAVQPDYIRRLPSKVHRRADRVAAQAALASGITTLHNIIIGDASYEELAEIYIDNSVLPIHVISKSCTTDVAKAKRLGGRIFGGDIFIDGSLGSHTAALFENYHDQPGVGLLYLTHEQLADLFLEAAQAGLSPGVHAIGDRAIEQALAAWEKVATRRGSLAGLRPSIDHFELARPEQIQRAAHVGVILSVQPAFDLLWGGAGAMYEQRLGERRANMLNLFRTAKRCGCTIVGGSDSPVTALSALLGIHALVNHHREDERFSIDEALAAYTADAAVLSFAEDRSGRLIPGYAADFTVLEKRLNVVPADAIKDVRVILTCVDGEVRYDALA